MGGCQTEDGQMNVNLDYDEIKKIEVLNVCGGNITPFHAQFDSCCDYVDSIQFDGKRYGVTVFVEPCGDITKWGASWDDVLDWWIAVFRAQPESWGYLSSGWHLWDLFERGLPDNAGSVWPDDVVAYDAELERINNAPFIGPLPEGVDKVTQWGTPITPELIAASDKLASALSDPFEMWMRSFVPLTDEQNTTIHELVEAGDTAGAQRIILQNLGNNQ